MINRLLMGARVGATRVGETGVGATRVGETGVGETRVGEL